MSNLSTNERLILVRHINALLRPEFETILFALNVPNAVIPSGQAAQGNRAYALLQWIESPNGCGLMELLGVLEQIAPVPFNCGLDDQKNVSISNQKYQERTEKKKIRIFLAHAKEDKAAVMKLYNRLKARGYKPWLDKKDLLPGQKWREVIPEVIENSDIFIACLSRGSISKRGYIQQEFKMALIECARRPSKSIFLIPVRLDDCEIPDLRNAEYGVNLKDYHWLDYFESDGFELLERAISHQFGQLIETELQAEVIPEVHIPATPKDHEPQPSTVAQRSFTEKLPVGIELEMTYIPGGEFMMGSPENEEGRYTYEGPQHRVTVPPFCMGKYPVTQAQWYAISCLNKIDTAITPAPSYYKGNSLPVSIATWHRAVEFCKRLSVYTSKDYRLPSEAEWEYACRAGTSTAYSFGNSITPEQANFNGNVGKTTPVGSYPANAFGLHDMHGNVDEWCQDHWHVNYNNAPIDGSAWIEGGNSTLRIIRGGSWPAFPRYCRSAYRPGTTPGNAAPDLGFRVCCSPPRSHQ